VFKTIRDAFKVKEIRDRLLFTLICLVIVRLGSLVPAPSFLKSVYTDWLSSKSIDLGFLNTLTGGSFEKMSIFALNISPYITASIIIQLLTIAIPKLEELQKDGEDGRKVITKITRYTSIGLAIIESIAMCIGFGSYLKGGPGFTSIVITTAAFTGGAAFLMWLGERMTEKGVGNGISMILLFNIVSSLPTDFANIYTQYVKGADSVIKAIIAVIVTLVVAAVTVVLVVLLQDGQRRIAVQYAKKVQGRKMVGGQSSFIPIKVNTAGVIPVIFSMSLMQFITIISSFAGVGANVAGNVWQKILCVLSSSKWFDFSGGFKTFWPTVGVLIYIGLNIFFAYFYTAITFNPNETANNLKTQSGFIPGIRPGRPTADYLTKVLNYIIFIGAVGLSIVAVIPMIFSGVFSLALSFGGTSIIIIVGVILETMQQVESMMVVRHYRGFLSE
jgi:preprotein translocase subunit SecY